MQNFGFCYLFNVVPYKAGIYAWADVVQPAVLMMTPQPPPVFVVPGMYVGCTAYDALIVATLECFFDAACLNTTAQWISVLPANALPKPLDSSLTVRFPAETIVGSILAEDMVDVWRTVKNFSAYYDACAPMQCTYALIQGNDFLYVMTMLIGLIGGLTVVLRIIAKLVVTVGRRCYNYFKKPQRAAVRIERPSTSSMTRNWGTQSRSHWQRSRYVIAFSVQRFARIPAAQWS